MPSSASYTESQTGSQSSRGPHIMQWLPQLVLVALVSLAVASIIGVSLSAVAFSNTEELGRPGHGIAQCFVLFASMISLFYVPLHLLAARKGESLYLSPPLSSFRHLLHAWSILMIRITAALWSGATAAVAVAIYRGGGGSRTVRLNVNMFACATGLLFSALVLTVIQFARHPFTLPWISPPLFDINTSADGVELDKFGEKTAAPSTAGSTTTETSSERSTDGSSTLRGSPSPTVQRSKASSPSSSPPSSPPSSSASSAKVLSSGTTSRSTSTTRSRSTKRARTKRYRIERPAPSTPVLKRQNSSGSTGGSASVGTGSASSSEGGSPGGINLEEELVPGPEGFESYFEAAPHSPSSSASTAGSAAGQSVQGRDKGKGKEGPVTPEARASRYGMNHRIAAASGSPSMFRFGRKCVVKPGPGGKQQDGSSGGGQKMGGQETSPRAEQAVPPPPTTPPPPPPVPTYYVPGAWVTQGNSEEMAVEA